MHGKAFIDTNLLLYYVSNDLMKKKLVHELLLGLQSVVVSTQVINEFVSVSFKKKINSRDDTLRYANEFMGLFDVMAVDSATIRRSFELMRLYNYSSWDSLIIASALQSNATLLYSEDLQHKQKIDGKLTIINPFA